MGSALTSVSKMGMAVVTLGFPGRILRSLTKVSMSVRRRQFPTFSLTENPGPEISSGGACVAPLVIVLALITGILLSPRLVAAQNPTWLSANPSVITMPGNVTFCAGGAAGMTVDLQYYWNGVLYETDSGVSFGANGCVVNFYNNNAFAGNYTFVAIRNSLNGPTGGCGLLSTRL